MLGFLRSFRKVPRTKHSNITTSINAHTHTQQCFLFRLEEAQNEGKIEIKIIIAFFEIMVYVPRLLTFNDCYACESFDASRILLPTFFFSFSSSFTHKASLYVICDMCKCFACGNKSETTFMSGLSECCCETHTHTHASNGIERTGSGKQIIMECVYNTIQSTWDCNNVQNVGQKISKICMLKVAYIEF